MIYEVAPECFGPGYWGVVPDDLQQADGLRQCEGYKRFLEKDAREQLAIMLGSIVLGQDVDERTHHWNEAFDPNHEQFNNNAVFVLNWEQLQLHEGRFLSAIPPPERPKGLFPIAEPFAAYWRRCLAGKELYRVAGYDLVEAGSATYNRWLEWGVLVKPKSNQGILITWRFSAPIQDDEDSTKIAVPAKNFWSKKALSIPTPMGTMIEHNKESGLVTLKRLAAVTLITKSIARKRIPASRN